MKITIAAVTVALATAVFAFGEPPKGKGERGGNRPVPQEMLKKFDKDGDGKLNEDERKAAGQARKAEMLKRFDKDGDGKLSEEEREALPKRGPRGEGKGKGKPEGKGGKKGPKKGEE